MNNQLLESYYQYVCYGAFITFLTSITLSYLNFFRNKTSNSFDQYELAYGSNLMALAFIMIATLHLLYAIIFRTTFKENQHKNISKDHMFLVGFVLLIAAAILIIISIYVEMFEIFSYKILFTVIPVAILLVKYLIKIKKLIFNT